MGRQATAMKDLWHLIILQQLWSTGGKVFVEDEQGDLTQRYQENMEKIWVWIHTYENIILSGMNIHKSQLFYDVNRRGTRF